MNSFCLLSWVLEEAVADYLLVGTKIISIKTKKVRSKHFPPINLSRCKPGFRWKLTFYKCQIHYRRDTRGLDMPTLAETFPDKFMDPKVFRRCREATNVSQSVLILLLILIHADGSLLLFIPRTTTQIVP